MPGAYLLVSAGSRRSTLEAPVTKETVLILGSDATQIELQGGGFAAIGQYLNETVVPAMALIDAGYDLVLATPTGAKPHIDEASDSAEHFGGDEAAYDRAKRFFAEDASMNEVRTLRSVIDDGLDRYAAVFVPGGHAPAVDLMQDYEVGGILRHFHEAAKPTALLCHGPIAVLAALPKAREFRAALIARDDTKAAALGENWIYAGYRMTVFSSSEENMAEENLLHGKLFFHMPQALRLAGGEVATTPEDFTPFALVDRELITAQNPQSDRLVAEKLIAALNRSLATA